MLDSPHVRTAALVILVFLILAMLSRMSAPEVQLDVSVRNGVRKFISKSQQAHAQVTTSAHPVHNLINLTQALSYMNSALDLAAPKHCEQLTGCKVSELHKMMSDQQEETALRLFSFMSPPAPIAPTAPMAPMAPTAHPAMSSTAPSTTISQDQRRTHLSPQWTRLEAAGVSRR